MKADNTERYFDPTKFAFLFTTNTLGSIYSNIDDNSIITRFQFLIFRNIIEDSKSNGLWYDDFFDSPEDKQSSIDTIINIIIRYKKAQSLKQIPKTEWSNVTQTKDILKEQMPKKEKYFDQERIIRDEGNKLSITDIKKDIDSFVGYSIKEQSLGYLLKSNGFTSSASNGITWFKGWKLDPHRDQHTLEG